MIEFTPSWFEQAEKILIRDEGERLKPYKDAAGKLTIGIGRNLDDVGITQWESRALFRNDLFVAIEGAEDIFGVIFFDQLSSARQHGLLNLIFNLGKDGFLKFHNTIAAIKNNDWQGAAKHLRSSLWYKQVGKRAERVILLLEKEVYAESYIK